MRKRPLDFIKLAEKNKNNNKLLFLMIGDGALKDECLKFIKNKKLKNICLKALLTKII